MAKIITLQAFWYIAVMYGHLYQYPILLASIILALANFFIYRPQVSINHYLICLALFVIYGIFQEWSFQFFELVDYNQNSFPWWLTALYFIFIAYYGDVFNYLEKKSNFILFILGAIGGFSAYYGGAKISPLIVKSPNYYFAVALSWGFFFPLSIRFFYMTNQFQRK